MGAERRTIYLGDEGSAPSCPHCGQVNNAHVIDDGHPAPCAGDYAVCIRCRGTAVFVAIPGGRFALRECTPAESALFRREHPGSTGRDLDVLRGVLADAGIRAVKEDDL